MKVTVVSVNEDTIRFIVDGIDSAFANALRRTMISEVPTMAIEDIFYYDNTSVVPDEVLAHRIGLVPLKTDLEHYRLPAECDCKADLGCPKCRVTLSLSVKAGDERKTVYSGDLQPVDPAITPVSPYIPLAKLAPGQSISLEAYAQLGKGHNHTKWSPVAMAIYMNAAEIKTDAATAAKCLEESPKGVILTKKDTVKVVDIQAFNRSPACTSLLKEGALKDRMKMDEFVFTVESTGALPPEKIVSEAVKVLNAKLDELKRKVDAGELHEEIEDFEAPTEVGRHLYSIGSGEFEEEEEGEEGGGATGSEPTYDEQGN
jgi:DNA-directed RNA polymerase subunit D